MVIGNPLSVIATYADNEDIKASENYDASENLAKSNDGDSIGIEVLPIVQFDNESSKEALSEVSSPLPMQNVDAEVSSTKVIPNVLFESGSNKENPPTKYFCC